MAKHKVFGISEVYWECIIEVPYGDSVSDAAKKIVPTKFSVADSDVYQGVNVKEFDNHINEIHPCT